MLNAMEATEEPVRCSLDERSRFFALSLDLLCIVDTEGVIRDVSASVRTLLGYREEEIIGNSYLRYIHPDDRLHILRGIEAQRKGRDQVRFEFRLRCKDRSYRWMEAACSAPREKNAYLYIVCRDIAERKKLRDALLEWKNRYEAAAQAGLGILYEWDRGTDQVVWNGHFEQMLGYPRAAMPGRMQAWLDLIHPADRPAYDRQVQAVLHVRQATHLRYRVRRNDGAYVLVRNDAQWFATAEGKWLHAIGFITDLSDQQRYEERFRRMIESSPAGNIITDAQGAIQYANPRIEAMFGYMLDELLGQKIEIFLPVDLREKHVQLPQDHMSGPRPMSRWSGRELVGRHKSGASIPVEVGLNAFLADNGMQVICTIIDLSERKERLRLQEDLQTARSVQARLYPHTAPRLAGFDIAGNVFPCTAACGDYYDFVPLAGDRVAIMIGDVSGHGLGPALQMVEMRATLRAMLLFENSLEVILKRLNESLMHDLPNDLFVSLFLSVLDVRQQRLEYVGAGHDAYLLRADGQDVHLDSTTTLLGILPALATNVAGAALQSGDILLLATDGITETFSPGGELFGWRRMVKVVRAHRDLSAEDLVKTLYGEVQAFAGFQPQADDISLIVVKAA